MKRIFTSIIFSLFLIAGYAQNVGINNDNSQPNSKAILDLKSTTMGFLPPRMSTVDRNNLTVSLTVNEDGLQVYNTDKGNIEYWNGSKWNSIVPIGTIQAFSGDETQVPKGWLLCDGRQYDAVAEKKYADLAMILNGYWGNSNQNNFKVPDLRGMFLRGTDRDNGSGLAGRDPDILARTNIDGTVTLGGVVGSHQIDATKKPNSTFDNSPSGGHNHGGGSHTHSGTTGNENMNMWYNNVSNCAQTERVSAGTNWYLNTSINDCIYHQHSFTTNGPNSTVISPVADHTHTISGGDMETRPVNAYVNYIIKY